MSSVFVRNNSGLDFADRYDGQDYEFPQGQLVECPIEAATHIFGYGLADKNPNMIRLGWAANSGGLKDAYARLDKFEFLQGVMQVMEPATENPPVVKPESDEDEVTQTRRIPEVAVNPSGASLLSKISSLAG